MNKPSRLRFLFAKYLQRQCSSEELDELVLLMQETGADDTLKDEMELLWEEFTDDKIQHMVDWQEMYSAVVSSEKRTDLLIHKATSRGKGIYYAIIILLLAGAFFLVYVFLSRAHNFWMAGSNGHDFFIKNSGNDSNDGSITGPWKTINRLNAEPLHPGDKVYFEGGQVFTGNILLDSNDRGSHSNPIVITSTGKDKAVIDGGNGTAFTAYKTAFLEITGLECKGAGRKNGNVKDGVVVQNCHDIKIGRLIVRGFQKAGLLIYSSEKVDATNVYATDNGFAGIFITGDYGTRDCSSIHLAYCTAENNPGDPSNVTNHSGNGILAGVCKNVVIEYCVATNNGWDMPRKGNGPVGIWCYEADSVAIQHCISYKNKTAPGAADGGGFDLDGGVTNSVIQYCLSYENEGSGYGLFQYAGAGNWNNNIIRYCISENDGSISPAHAGIFIWNSSEDTAQLKNCYVYNNTIYNTKGAVINYEAQSKNSGFRFYNNIFVGKDSLILGIETNSTYLGNDWYSLDKGFMAVGIDNFATWCMVRGKEKWNDKTVGFNINPGFRKPGTAGIVLPSLLETMDRYRLPGNSPLLNGGLDLKTLFGIETGHKSLNGKNAPEKGIGAVF
jgi:hypothetical protein